MIGVKFESPLPPGQGTILKHCDGLGVEGPVGTFARTIWSPGNLDEAVVEAKVVTEGVLPPMGVLAIIWEGIHDELVDLRDRQHLFLSATERHGYQGHVGVGRLPVPTTLS